MSVKKYKFVSPGIFINEIDNSQLPSEPTRVGPVIIGQTARGPAMRPVTVGSYSEFVQVFGDASPGAQSGDLWRDNQPTCPTYASYAAKAWLRNNTPVTIVRLLGTQHNDAATTQAAGMAGWITTDIDPDPDDQKIANAGGAYGLFIIPSGTTEPATVGYHATSTETGSLAAIWYCNKGTSVYISGSYRGLGSESTGAAGTLIQSDGSGLQFTAVVASGADGGETEKITFNFSRNSPKYIRKAFNTNPTLTNSDVYSSTKSYWLGETYDRFLTQGDGGVSAFGGCSTGTSAGGMYGVVLQISDQVTSMANRLMGAKQAQTPWVIAQDFGAYGAWDANNANKLFKLHTRKAGEYEMHNLKVSVQDLKASTSDNDPYSTFTLVIRRLQDNDGKIQQVERYGNLNLNPNSPNYIARRIGDKYTDFDSTTRRNREYGQYDNKSDFVRVEMDPDLDLTGPADPAMVPFGFFGPPRFKGFVVMSGSTDVLLPGSEDWQTTAAGTAAYVGHRQDQVLYPEDAPGGNNHTGAVTTAALSGDFGYTGSFLFPTIPIRVSSSDGGLPSDSMAYHGFATTRSDSSTVFDESIRDHVRSLPDSINTDSHANPVTNSPVEIPFIFTLDDVVSGSTTSGETRHAFNSGSRQRGHSISAAVAGYAKNSVTKYGWEAVVHYGADKFTMPLFGGFDGVNITEPNPFNNADLDGKTERTSYAYNTIKQAIDIVRDPEEHEFNIMVAPNVQESTLTNHMINVCEDRADALAIIDLEGDFKPATENTDAYSSRVGSVDQVVDNLNTRQLDSSYACAYFPYVQMYDRENDAFVYIPPSIVGLGVMSNSENKSELWFAPAGFNRGGLSNGAAGVAVVGTTLKLTKEDRDKLYLSNVNPIASFPSEGLVVFGQKTLQVTPSALDRVNVRRLMIFLKKEISRIAATILFDQNVESTWNRFTGKVEPLLRSVKARFGLEAYKLVLDNTTTTPDLVDRNVLYAKVFLKPAKAIEFIAIDFNITNQGAAFED